MTFYSKYGIIGVRKEIAMKQVLYEYASRKIFEETLPEINNVTERIIKEYPDGVPSYILDSYLTEIAAYAIEKTLDSLSEQE